MLIDFHAHAFEDGLAPKAMAKLIGNSGLPTYGDGTVATLLANMKRTGVDRTVLCPIATRPRHFDGILEWARTVRAAHGDRLEVFCSVHPEDPDALAHIDLVADEGFKGVKFHPYYQDFTLDEARMIPLYERLRERNLLAVFHCGFDIAFPFNRIGDPRRIRKVCDDLPGFKFVATHFGGWRDWEEARKWLIGQPIYMEASLALQELPWDVARAMALEHPAEYLLFGTDQPWSDAAEERTRWRALDLPEDRLAAVFSENAIRLLREAGSTSNTD